MLFQFIYLFFLNSRTFIFLLISSEFRIYLYYFLILEYTVQLHTILYGWKCMAAINWRLKTRNYNIITTKHI